MNKHVVICKTDLRYDGRITSIINTLSNSFKKDEIIVYNLIDYYISPHFLNKNVEYYGFISLLNRFKRSHLIQVIKSIQFNIYVLFKLIKYSPKTIQLHHEPVLLAGLLYKLLFRKVVLVYNDQEIFRYKEANIPKLLYLIERKVMKVSNLIIYTNEYRKRLSGVLYNNKLVKSIIIDNYVFDASIHSLNNELKEKVDTLKSKYKLLVHQGSIDKNRGKEEIISLIPLLPSDWIITFLGIDNNMFNEFAKLLNLEDRKKIYNFGKIPFEDLNSFWSYTADAALIIYKPISINNNYCAPNRLYAAVNVGVPILVNGDNFTLYSFIKKYLNGCCIDKNEAVQTFFEEYNSYLHNSKKLATKFQYNKTLDDLSLYYASLK